jgi:MFS family permease
MTDDAPVTSATVTGSAVGGGAGPVRRRGYRLTAGLLPVIMLGGTLPVPLYVLWQRQMGFGPLGVTAVFAAYVIGTLAVLVTFGDLSDHIGRRRVLAIGIGCAAVSTAGFLIASGIAPGIGLLVGARIVSGLAAGFVTGTATAALAELQPRGDRQAAAVVASGANMTGLGLGPLIAGLFAEYVAAPTRTCIMPVLSPDTPDAAELAELPQFPGNWPAADPGQPGASPAPFTGSEACNGGAPGDLTRFAFPSGSSDGEHLLRPEPVQ